MRSANENGSNSDEGRVHLSGFLSSSRVKLSSIAMIFDRWTSFTVAIWVMAVSGTNYTFANYSSALKSALGINQVQLDTLSFAKDLGKALGIVAGISSDWIPASVVLLIGSTLGFLGFGVQWLVVSGTIDPLPYWTVWVAAAVGGNSVAWLNTAVLLVSVGNFPRNRGPVVGLLKAYLGLSAAIFSALCDCLFSGSSSAFLLLLTLAPSAVCLFSAPFLRPSPPSSPLDLHDRVCLHSLFVFASSLASFLALIQIFPASSSPSRLLYTSALLFLLLTPASLPVVSFIHQQFCHADQKRSPEALIDVDSNSAERGAAPNPLQEEPLRLPEAERTEYCSDGDSPDRAGRSHPAREQSLILSANTDAVGDSELLLPKEPPRLTNSSWKSKLMPSGSSCCGEPLPELGDDRSILQVLRSPSFWVYYVSCVCAGGAGLTLSNNLGQVGLSIGFQTVTTFTALFSLGGFSGRILSGILSEHFLRKYALPRSAWMAATKLPMIAMFLWLAGGSQISLYVGTVVIGLCYGFQMAIMIPMISEFYGLKHFGTNYNAAMTVLLVGSLLFSDLLAGILYDQAAGKQNLLLSVFISASLRTVGPNYPSSPSETLTCSGPQCYCLTFITLALILLIGVTLDIVLALMTRPLYIKLQKINTSK